MRQVLLYEGESGFWIAEVPSLPGCITQGTTQDEAIENVKEAISAYIEVLNDLNPPIPQEKFTTLLVAV